MIVCNKVTLLLYLNKGLFKEIHMFRMTVVNPHLFMIVWNKVTTKRSPTSRVTTKLVVGNPCFVHYRQATSSPRHRNHHQMQSRIR